MPILCLSPRLLWVSHTTPDSHARKISLLLWWSWSWCRLYLLSKASLLYSNTHIQYISTNNPLARKQANSITSLHNQQRVYLMPRYKTSLFVQTFCLLSRASLSASQHSTRPSWPLHLPQVCTMEGSVKIFAPARRPHRTSHGMVRGWTKGL